ncbi:MAG: F0F1 ATP synthase subunit A [Magnetococcales bacterium]|nr:F0F1 ATP synthase subunit A [Magnetococcales bacterium]
MTTEQGLSPTSYINHHLTQLTHSVGDSPFWTLHVDTVVVSLLLGVVGFGFLRWVVSGATSGVPGKRQAFVELAFEFVDREARGIFHGDRHRFLAPTALTVFVWVLLMNAMDFLPVDIMAWFFTDVLHLRAFRAVPTADINTTFALSLVVWLLMIYFSVVVKGWGGWVHELIGTPFGSHPLLWPVNFLFNLVELVSKPLSHSLRLYGNMYAGEIVFLLLGMWAATGLSGAFFGVLLGAGWAVFHILIVVLQAFIFMMLTIVYIAMAHESH